MEKTRKILAVLTILVMALCMTTTVFAAGEGTITIKSAVKDQDYNAYRIFDLESYSTTTGAYSYKINDEWDDFAKSEAAKEYISVDPDGYVTWIKKDAEKKDIGAAEFAQLALAYAKDTNNNISAEASKKADATTVEFTGLDLGYYLVDSTVGTLCELTTTATEVTITEKNEEPTIKHYVNGDAADGEEVDWIDTNTENIGDTVNHKVVINAKEGAENYVLTVDNSDGLTNPTVTEVKIGNTTSEDRTLVDPANYTVTPITNEQGEPTGDFKVEFKKEFLDTLTDTSVIEVFHTETLNKNAVIAGTGNTSTATLTYGESNGATASDTVVTYTYEFDLVKTKTDNTVLEGATFKLYDAETAGNEIKVVAVEGQTGVYRVALEGETGVVESIPAGQAKIQGLGNGTYYLEEVAAPEGYNELSSRAAVTITDGNNNATVTAGKYDTEIGGGVQVINKTGTELPTTGGMGTTILYIIGGALMIGAGVTIVARKKMANQK